MQLCGLPQSQGNGVGPQVWNRIRIIPVIIKKSCCFHPDVSLFEYPNIIWILLKKHLISECLQVRVFPQIYDDAAVQRVRHPTHALKLHAQGVLHQRAQHEQGEDYTG